MRAIQTILGAGLVACAVSARANISLFEWGVNMDGTITGTGDPLPSGSAFDESTGLGTIKLTFSGAGAHSGLVFVDHEMSEAVNTFFNEVGAAVGTPGAGLSWEIDEPGWTFGNIYNNFTNNTLDDSVGTPDPEDVSMALGYDFTLVASQKGIMTMLLSETAPTGVFYLRHNDPNDPNDPNDDENVYFSASLQFEDEDDWGVPDGGSTLLLMLGALGGLAGLRACRKG